MGQASAMTKFVTHSLLSLATRRQDSGVRVDCHGRVVADAAEQVIAHIRSALHDRAGLPVHVGSRIARLIRPATKQRLILKIDMTVGRIGVPRTSGPTGRPAPIVIVIVWNPADVRPTGSIRVS